MVLAVGLSDLAVFAQDTASGSSVGANLMRSFQRSSLKKAGAKSVAHGLIGPGGQL
jgi:hypothetical protein